MGRDPILAQARILLGPPLAAPLRSLLYDLDRVAGAGDKVKRGLAGLRSFVGALQVEIGEVSLGLGRRSRPAGTHPSRRRGLRNRRPRRNIAELGPGAHRTGDIADTLGLKVSSLGPVRAKLIRKGMIYRPAHGDIAFTVPLFDEFMRRVIPAFPR